MSKASRHMLIELPPADEIDDLAITTPRLEVRKFEFDLTGSKANLEYSPCKGQVILVVRGETGTVLVRSEGAGGWILPSGKVGVNEEFLKAAKRVVREQCGVGVRGLQLNAMYDVVWHHSDVSIKRLHLVYSGQTDDSQSSLDPGDESRIRFFKELPESFAKDQMLSCAMADSHSK